MTLDLVAVISKAVMWCIIISAVVLAAPDLSAIVMTPNTMYSVGLSDCLELTLRDCGSGTKRNSVFGGGL